MATIFSQKKRDVVLIFTSTLLLFAILFTFMNVFGNETGTASVPDSGMVTRSISPESEWVGSTFTLTYTYDPNLMVAAMNKGPSLSSYTYIDWKVTIKETIPDGFTPSSTLPDGFSFDADTNELMGTITVSCGKGMADCKALETSGAITVVSIPLSSTGIGEIYFEAGQYGYTFDAVHNGKAYKHQRNLSKSTTSLPSKMIDVLGAHLILPSTMTVFVKDAGTVTATLDGELPDGAYLDWVVETPTILQQTGTTNTSLSFKAVDVGTSIIRATYRYPTGFVGESNDLLLTTKLPNLSLVADTTELWVYRNELGDFVQQSTPLTLNQFRDDGSEMDEKFRAVWSTSSNALAIYADGEQSATIEAQYGSTGSVYVNAALEGYPFHSQTAAFTIKEYPQNMSTPNVVLYVEDDPYVYPVIFYPETANVTGYTMTVVEGSDVVRVEGDTLRPLKPGLARVRLDSEDVSVYFPYGDGPKQLSRTFYVLVKSGSDPNPETDLEDGDYY